MRRYNRNFFKFKEIVVIGLSLVVIASIAFFSTQSSGHSEERSVQKETAVKESMTAKEKTKDHYGEKELEKTEGALKKAQSQEAQNPNATNDEKKKVAYLTFDDGPSPYTHQLLDILERYQAKATFFMLEPNMEKHADAIARIIKDGDAVGMHGVTHNKALFYQSKFSVINEMDTGRKKLKELTGVDSKLIRTPYGSVPNMTPEYRKEVDKQGYKMWDWNVDSRDWAFRNPHYVQYTINGIQNVEQNGHIPIILLHDKQPTIQSLPSLLEYLKANHYELRVLTAKMEPFQFPEKN